MELLANVGNILGDHFHLTNVFHNLIENAIKYSSSEALVLNISTRVRGAFIETLIQDNGIGVDKASQNKIFEKFYRVPTGNVHNVKGVGLGLYYVKLSVEHHQGTINIDDNVDKGACFVINLPLVS